MRQALVKELRIREKELTEELDAIRKILVSNTISSEDKPSNNSASKGKTLFGTTKGGLTWKEYVKLLLSEIGGTGKYQDVVKKAIESNPEIDEKTIRSAVRAKLSKLYQAKEIKAEKGKIKSEGYKYYL